VAQAIDRAHHLAASGLDEARRVIATERGDELPGPERIGALSTLSPSRAACRLPSRSTASRASSRLRRRLAVYRTAQEALTNVRRHATAERVEVTLNYLPDSTVLVVEDRESLATLLGLLGGIELVATASDGEEALALTAEHRPDVVLMDLRMPRMDGIEATGRLRERQPDVRVIALTTYADDESVLRALRAGARGQLRLPHGIATPPT
jgi:CheY-like chemotaxis protein